jgi:copper homeostasis protein (lipoprotein)
MHKALWLALMTFLPGTVIAQEAAPFIGAHGATTPGAYVAGPEAAPAQLDLWPDQSFHFVSEGAAHAGRWHADPRQNGIVLDLGDRTVAFEVRNAQRLRPSGAPEDGTRDLELAENFVPAPLTLQMSGMLTYFADAATIVHCATGRTYPVAMEGDYLTLERAYLRDQPGPAEPLFVTLEATIETRDQMEGPPRLTVVPDTFGTTFPGEDCSLGNRRLGLADAVWTITALGDMDLARPAKAREAFLSVDAGAQAFFASVGCNTLRGRFEASGDTLRIAGPVASTMMACPAPLSDWEARLAEVLSAVASYDIGGRTLRLLDANGERLATLQAVYLP